MPVPLRDEFNWLIVLFEPQLTLGRRSAEPPELFTISNVVYRRRVGGGVKATFDRLLDIDGLFVGLQVWPVAAVAGDLLSRLPRRQYLEFPPEVPCFQLFFGGRPVPEIESSGEQALSADIYDSSTGSLAMTFDLRDFLESGLDARSISEAHAQFVRLD